MLDPGTMASSAPKQYGMLKTLSVVISEECPQLFVGAIKTIYGSLADELVKVHKMKPTAKWKEKFESYLSTMPNYYAGVSIEVLFDYYCMMVLSYLRSLSRKTL